MLDDMDGTQLGITAMGCLRPLALTEFLVVAGVSIAFCSAFWQTVAERYTTFSARQNTWQVTNQSAVDSHNKNNHALIEDRRWNHPDDKPISSSENTEWQPSMHHVKGKHGAYNCQ